MGKTGGPRHKFRGTYIKWRVLLSHTSTSNVQFEYKYCILTEHGIEARERDTEKNYTHILKNEI